ncbi:MAG: hypothetical protein LBL21_04170 [Rickettsiales bacterium]|nr:hypothetical protein [Rickettsiales bacterium]
MKRLFFAAGVSAILAAPSSAASICVVDNPNCATKVAECRAECNNRVHKDDSSNNGWIYYNQRNICHQMCTLFEALCS